MPKTPEVTAWFATYDNPMKEVVQRVREIIVEADPRIEECIEGQAPTFTFKGDLASFFPESKQHARLIFHLGAQIPGNHPRLEGGDDTSRMMKVASLAEAERVKGDLEAIVAAWCAWREAGGTVARKASAPKPKAPADKPKASKPKPKPKLKKKVRRCE